MNSKKSDNNLEALRGFAAIFVVIHHIMLREKVHPNSSTHLITIFGTPGHLSVIIFFVLSGYVIGLTNEFRLTGKGIINYLKKRFIRLYPIYLISILLALFVASARYPISTIIGNLTFSQVLVSNIIEENNPIWSLNYEVLYYLLFIGISFFSLNPIKIVICSLLVGIVNILLYPHINLPLISSYAFGFAFWSTGLVIAKYISEQKLKPDYSKLLAAIFLILCLNTFNVITTAFIKFSNLLFGHIIGFPNSVDPLKRIITFSDISYLPYCILLVLLFSEKEFKYRKQLCTSLQLLPVLTFVYILNNKGKYDSSLYILHTIYFAMSLFCYFIKIRWIENISKKIIQAGLWLGSISYGIYIIHFPVLVLFSKMNAVMGLQNFVIRLGLQLSIIITVSYLLERIFHLWIKSWLTQLLLADSNAKSNSYITVLSDSTQMIDN